MRHTAPARAQRLGAELPRGVLPRQRRLADHEVEALDERCNACCRLERLEVWGGAVYDSPSGSGASSGGSKASSGALFSGPERRTKNCSKLLRAACLHRLGFGPRRMLQVSTVLREALPPAPQAPLKGRAARRAEKNSAIGETPARSGSEARVRQRWRNPYPHADCQTERDEPDTIGTRPTGRAYVV